MIESIKGKIRDRIVRLLDTEIQETMEYMFPQLLLYHNSLQEERQSFCVHTKDPFESMSLYAHLKDRLLAVGVPVDEVDLDLNDFERWMENFPEISDFYRNMGEVRVEKCLEHYLVYRFLNITKNDLYIDIAALSSPWANILERRGTKSFRLDIAYPAGTHGNNIGADAGDTKLPDQFASVLSAQCAFECFMGDADIRFVKEAARILTKNGRYGIVPLYLEDIYFVLTSPYCNQHDVIIEPEAKRVWREDAYKIPFSRHYSPESFKSRIYSAIPASMTGKILFFRNLTDIMRHFEGQKVYCSFMFRCEKK
jgi:hypothetical protein